jgi:hypothetical protein
MNIDTGEIRNLNDLSEKEKKSGRWVEIPAKYLKQYVKKTPTTDDDYAALNTAEAKRAEYARWIAERLENHADDVQHNHG